MKHFTTPRKRRNPKPPSQSKAGQTHLILSGTRRLTADPDDEVITRDANIVTDRIRARRPGTSRVRHTRMTTQPQTIPETPGEITEAWLTEALRSTGVISGATVAAIERETLGEGAGFIGQLERLSLTYDGIADGAHAQ